MNPYNAYPPQGYPGRPMPPSPLQLKEYRRPIRHYANVIGGGLLMLQVTLTVFYLILDYAFSFLDYSALSYEVIDLIDQFIDIAYYSLGFWIPTIFIIMVIGIPMRVAIPLRKPRMSLVIPAVCIALGMTMVGSILGSILEYQLAVFFGVTPFMPDMPLPVGVPAGILYFISTAIAPAIFEEVMFRGAIMQSLRRFGDGFALITSSILFGLMHGNLVQAPNATMLGLIMGYFVLRTGSLWTSMLIHFVNNGLVVLYSYMGEYMTDFQYEILNVSVFAIYLLLGGAALVYLLVKHGNPFRMPASDYPLSEGRKHFAFYTSVAMIFFLLLTLVMMILYLEPVIW